MTRSSGEGNEPAGESVTHPAALSEARLLQDCQLRRQRRSGPGGQHRNKVETAVVITHLPTGIRGEASERRSQEENRVRALFRLRVQLALQVRTPATPDASGQGPSPLWRSRCQGGRLVISGEHTDFPVMLAEALDVLGWANWDAANAAARLGCTPSQLIKFLQKEPQALPLVNAQRQATGRASYR